MQAVYNDHPPVVKLLLEAKASTTLRGGTTDETAFELASRMRHDECIQLVRWMNTLDLADAGSVAVRFAVGERVLCYTSTRNDDIDFTHMGEATWTAGTVVKVFYTQKAFPAGKAAPYQVKLDDHAGRTIYVPKDADNVICPLETEEERKARLDAVASGGRRRRR